jgi:Domain of unknown function (DUF6293)/DUF6293 C-terminal winged helix domain
MRYGLIVAMDSGMVRLRVHIAPVGKEVLRVVEPMRVLYADVALVMTPSSTGPSSLIPEKIKRQLEAKDIPTQIVECNVQDTSEVVNAIGSIVSLYPRHEYFLNASTGPRAASIGGVIAAMFWSVRPYHVDVNEQAKPVNGEGDYPIRGPPRFIPTFEIPPLDKAAVSALEYVAGTSQPVSKGMLIGHLKQKGIVGPRQQVNVSDQALYGQLDTILHRLDTWGFVDLTGRGKETRIKVTDRGIEGRKMFFHMLNPRGPISILEPKV